MIASTAMASGSMRTADVCVVGGGLLGTATALFAARRGLRVLLLEASDLASGASGAAFGGCSVGIYSFASARVPESYVALSKASLALYAQLQEELGAPMDFTRPGSLDPFYDERDLESRKARAEGLTACGVDCRLLDRKEVQAVEPAVSDVVVGDRVCWSNAQGSYAEPQVVERTHVKFKLLVRLDPSATKEPAETSRTVRYEFYHRSDTETGVNFDVDFKGALRDEWLEQAFIPLEQCGANMLR